MGLCSTFKEVSHGTWQNLDRGKRFGFKLGEEGITDMNLLALTERHSHEIITAKSTKHQEGQDGADWEWWIGGHQSWLGFRVQAKVVNPFTNRFESLHYKTGRRFQCDTLIRRSLDDSLARIPLYCLYINLADKQFDYGCSLMCPFVVKARRVARTKDDQCGVESLRPYLVPWHKLVCPDSPTLTSLPPAMTAVEAWERCLRDSARELITSRSRRNQGAIKQPYKDYFDRYQKIVPVKYPPPYVKSMLESKTTDREWVFDEFRLDLSRVTVFRS